MEETSQSWQLLPFVSSIVGVAATSLLALLVYLYRTRTSASVEIVIETQPNHPPLINAVVINNGRSPIVVTVLRVHVPPEYIGASGKLADSLTDVPVWRRKCLLGLRRRLKTSGSRNDAIATSIKRAFPRGFARIDATKSGETIRVSPQEKASRMVPLNEWWVYFDDRQNRF